MAIDFNQLQMPNIAGNFMQGLQFAQQQQAAQEQQRQAQWAAQQAKQAMQTVYDNPTPENISRFYMQYPEYKKQFEESRAPLNDAAKAEDLGVSTRALVLLGNGKIDEVASMLGGRVGALKNTPGKETEAKALEAVIQIIKTDPQAGKQLLGMKIAAADPDLYKTVFGQSDMTGFQKDLMAAGIDPNSEEGRAKASEYVSLKTDPIVQMETPSHGEFIGRQSEYYRRYGGDAPAPTPKAVPKPGEVRNGYQFNGGDPANKANWSKVAAGQGGGVSNGTGSFRASGN